MDGRIAYLQAQSECLGRRAALIEARGRVRVEEVEPYLVRFDVPFGYGEDGVLREGAPLSMPIGSYGMRFDGMSTEVPTSLQRGYAVARRFAPLVEGFGEHAEELGSCRCVRTVYFGANDDDLSSLDSWRAAFAAATEYASERGLRMAGRAFVPYGTSTSEGNYMALCIPVEDEGRGPARARRLLQGLFGRTKG